MVILDTETMDKPMGAPMELAKLDEEDTDCTSYISEFLLLVLPPLGMLGFPNGEAEGADANEGEGDGDWEVVSMASRVPNLSLGPRY